VSPRQEHPTEQHIFLASLISCRKTLGETEQESHDGAGVGVVVAEHGDEPLLLRRRCAAAVAGHRHDGVDSAHVPRRRPLVVGRRGVGVRDVAVRDVGPDLGLLPRRLHPVDHLVRLHVPLHRHLVLLPVDLHGLHSWNEEIKENNKNQML
jgi:hypothetical protein